MTLHASDLVSILIVVAVGFGASYLLLLRMLRRMLSERQLKIAEQLGRLDDAIKSLETRLAESHATSAPFEPRGAGEQQADPPTEESEGVAPEIKAAIAAAAVAALGTNSQVKSIKPAGLSAASPWTQQGRVLVQGSHNLRVRR